MNKDLLLAVSASPSLEARIFALALLCSKKRRRRRQSISASPYARARDRLTARFKRSLVRVLSFAKHETLRKLHRYAFANRPLRADLIRLLHSELPAIIGSSASDTLDSLGYRDPWKVPAQETLDLIAARMNLIAKLPDELFADVQRELSEGLYAGESIDQLANRIANLFSPERAALIAETETSAAYGFASQAAAVQAGVAYKQWIHSGLPKEPREDHLDIDGLIVPIDEPYPVGDPPLMYPHDPDGSAEDVINCGCISIPATEEDFLKQEEG